MSQNQQPEDASGTEYEKEVTVVAYPEKGTKKEGLDWVAEVTGEPVNETETVRTEKLKITADIASAKRTITEDKSYIYDDSAEEIINELKGNEKVTAEEVVDVKEVPEVKERKGIRNFLEEIWDQLPEELGEGVTRNNNWRRYEDDRENHPAHPVKTRSEKHDTMRVLAKEAKREDDQLYEGMVEHDCIRFNVKLKAKSSECIDHYTEEVIENLHRLLAKQDGIGKVRYMSCQITEVREGDCYDI